MFRNTEYRSALFCFLAGIFQRGTMSVSPCSPPRPALGQHSLNALRLSRRDPKSMGGLCETWEGCFNCDLTAHLNLTLDRQSGNCNLVSFAPFSNHNGVNCSRLRPGVSSVYILVPWKPVVIVWLLLSGTILAGFIGSSLRACTGFVHVFLIVSPEGPVYAGFRLVELVGIEPTASSLRTTRSPS